MATRTALPRGAVRRSGTFASRTLGYVSYDIYEVLIFEDGYELWNTSTSSMIDSHAATTEGRFPRDAVRRSGTFASRTIGLRAGTDSGVWLDGTKIMDGMALTMNQPVTAGFGTHDLANIAGNQNGIILLENLNYIKSYHRTDADQEAPADGPRVTITNFDGPRPVRVDEPIWNPSTMLTEPFQAVNYTEDATRADHTFGSDAETQIYLPNGRRVTTLVIAHTADLVTYDGETRTVGDPGDELPGAKMATHVDAVGSITTLYKTSLTDAVVFPWDAPTGSHNYDGLYNWFMVSVGFGPYSGPEGTSGGAITASPMMASVGWGDGLSFGDGQGNSGGVCACRCADSSIPSTTAAYIAPELAAHTNFNGAYVNPAPSVALCSWDGDEVRNLLSKSALEFWIALMNAHFRGVDHTTYDNSDDYWKISVKLGGQTSGSRSLRGTTRDDTEIDDDEWSGTLASGADVQWGDGEGGGRWGVDFETRRFFFEGDEEEVAAMMEAAAKKFSYKFDSGKLDKSDWHDASAAWGERQWLKEGCSTDVTGADAEATQRRWSQLGYLDKAALLSAMQDAMDDQYGEGWLYNAALGGGAKIVLGAGSMLAAQIAKHVKNRRAASRTMRAALGLKKGDKRVGHHIVAWGDKRAKGAKKILDDLKIKIDGKSNGVALSRSKHRGLHTKDYYDKVNQLIESAYDNGRKGAKGRVEAALQEIADQLSNGTFMN